MEQAILDLLHTLDLDLLDCRGQSYDNAANMTGKYKGLQARILNQNPLAIFVPCSAHSLQLVGSAAAGSSNESSAYFALVQQLYNFFALSTDRWNLLTLKLKSNNAVLKSLSKTRWSARSDASQALHSSYEDIMDLLEEISTDKDQKKDISLEAQNILDQLKRLETAIMVCFWNSVLVEFNKVNVRLQDSQITVETVTQLYNSLHLSISNLRSEENFQNFEDEGITLSGCSAYAKDKKRKKKIKLPFSESAEGDEGHTEFEGKRDFVINKYYAALDILIVELTKRKEIYNNLLNKFSFL